MRENSRAWNNYIRRSRSARRRWTLASLGILLSQCGFLALSLSGCTEARAIEGPQSKSGLVVQQQQQLGYERSFSSWLDSEGAIAEDDDLMDFYDDDGEAAEPDDDEWNDDDNDFTTSDSDTLMNETEIEEIKKSRKLKGRFLHLTDMHPDPLYRTDGRESSACHRKKPRKEKARGGMYGLPYGECDSPMVLTNYTLDFLDKKWAKEVDFVVWTGDSARHDNDLKHPRTPDEIYMLNRDMVARMEEIFTKRGIPVVPCIGNNDVWPHNIMAAGPNSITNAYSKIWRSFIPFESFQVFQRGGYFSTDVIKDHVAAVSLNTMYFYDSNKAVGGCEYGDGDDPGNLQFDWLEVQLDRYRERGMHVWLTGHVPPSPGNYFPGCFVRYAEIALRYQDTILGHLFGHMNTDHFFFLNAEDMILPDEEENSDSKFGTMKKKKGKTLADILMKDFSELPSAKKTDMDEYAVINVSPSVVPNPYLPSFRVFSYNVTDAPSLDAAGDAVHLLQNKDMTKTGGKRKHGHRHPGHKEVDCTKKANRGTWACRPKKPFYASEDAPSRRNQLWTPLGYAQYWMPGVGEGNGTVRPRFRLEYLTYGLPSLHPPEGQALPVPLKELPRSLRAANATRSKSKYAPYGMEALTVGSWLRLGRRLGDKSRVKLRDRFSRAMYMVT